MPNGFYPVVERVPKRSMEPGVKLAAPRVISAARGHHYYQVSSISPSRTPLFLPSSSSTSIDEMINRPQASAAVFQAALP
ncbi:Hypothetical protein NTJ_04178 [Nesidiocoris tenuis]|uniref:Uncharacterized protein n=1 Tax=Nesidiocoris tenuis TaxID=355587 RepID=A0ABN7AGH7_9HEMI|nr:Hypothetical protein NTJ_04178 [Nesidiocoris tenuis]